MALIIDKRFLPKNKTSGSRQKFIERNKASIKNRIRELVDKGTLDKFNKGNKKIKINSDDLNTPGFEFEQGSGTTERIYIGNKKFHRGDKAQKPDKKGGQGGGAGNGGEGEDDFEFLLTEKEFTELFFEDLALPNFVKKEFLGSAYEIQHAGFSTSGGPSSLNIRKTMLRAIGRRLALTGGTDEDNKTLEVDEHGQPVKRKKIQFIEDIDLRYNFKDRVDVPVTRAVMFCLMDVSGSMGEKEKDIAKRFYILLNLFLKRNYEHVDVVFVRHAESALEVDEEMFFHGRISGGTLISSGYALVNQIIKDRYNPEQWNIYIAQATDGDNFPEDDNDTEKLLITSLLPVTQYFAYLEVASGRAQWSRNGVVEDSNTLRMIKEKMKSHPNLQGRMVNDYPEIYPIFRSLFRRNAND